MYVIAGCPVSGRAWVVKQWVAHLTRAAKHAEIDLIIYTLVPERDVDTAQAIKEACLANHVEHILECTDEEPRGESLKREWSATRYDQMVYLRNRMLRAVRLLGPDMFISVDSDILLNRYAISSMMDALQENQDYAAMGSKTWLHPFDEGITNGANLTRHNTLLRLKAEAIVPAKVLMAIVGMKPDAYHVNYESDPKGEDIGWSRRVTEAGFKMGFDGRVASKHIMSEADLHKIDPRVGW